MSKCKKTAGKNVLFVDTDEYVEDDLEIEGELMYNEEKVIDEVLLEGDIGTAVVRCSCLTSKASSEDD